MSAAAAPLVSDAMRHDAKGLAGQWLYVLDPLVDPHAHVPGDAVIGAWPVDDHGTIVENRWRPNPRYTPRTLTENDLVTCLTRLSTDALTAHDLHLIGHAEITVLTDTGGDPLTVHHDRPGPAVEAWVHHDHARTTHPDTTPRRTTVTTLATALPPHHGIEFVLPDNRRIGITADGINRLG